MRLPTLSSLITGIALACVCTALSMSAASAAGKKVTGEDAAGLLQICQLTTEPDKNILDFDVHDSKGQFCCSKLAGYCIDCDRGGDHCTKTAYSKRPDRSHKRTLSTPSDQVIAPVGGSSKRPTVKKKARTIPKALQTN